MVRGVGMGFTVVVSRFFPFFTVLTKTILTELFSKLYVKFWWPLFLAYKIRLFLAKSGILIPKCLEGGGGLPVKEIFLTIPFFSATLKPKRSYFW